MGNLTLFDLADSRGIDIPSSCGRQGSCNECIVEIRHGIECLEERTGAETFLRDPYRLACQAHARSADVDFAPLERRPQILTHSASGPPAAIDSPVRRHGDGVYYEDERLDDFRGAMFGIAADLGTTTVVLNLVSLESGRVEYEAAFENPQRFGGSDVISRISYDGGPNRGKLQKVMINAINAEIRAACRKLEIDRRQICEMIAVGNSTMRDLFFGLDVQPIGQRPYKSVIESEFLEGRRDTTALNELAHRLGILAHPRARIIGPPLVAGHAGADTTAALAAIQARDQHETFLLVDIGTNTEVVIGHQGRLLAASCPAGPAFEGGGIRFGMTGAEGAIEKLRLDGSEWRFEVIGRGPARGICGSGLIDLLAELRRSGRMTPKGVFANRAFEIAVDAARGITFSRQDASQLAQAKAANYCGQFILMRALGVEPEHIAKLYLAGGFANYIDVRNAIEIGFLAPVPEDRVRKIGNAALAGARRLLLSRAERAAAERIVRTIEHIELETTPDFFEIFVEGCQFKPMPAPKGMLV